MRNTLRLIRYHAVFLSIFSCFLLLTFYINEGGDLDTPSTLVLFYLASALLLYIPLVFILTILNFFILAVGLSFYRSLKHQVLICILPIVLFSIWFLVSNDSSIIYFWKLTDFEFFTIITIWITLLIVAFSVYTGMKKYLAISLLPVLFVSGWYAIQRYNITSNSLRLMNFHFNAIFVIWTTLNGCMLWRFHSGRMVIKKTTA
jgi:hypothetical protein